MSEIFRIVLRDIKRYDTYETREFDLPMNSIFPIGRSSRNAAKKELEPAPNNAYIDSPVISRGHALLSANASSGTPQVYITDSGSMHGTMVNGRSLVPNKPEQLETGDLVQFGVDVNRNEEYFVARKYAFESQLSRHFSLGFTVPDIESEEEDIDIDADAVVRQRHGTQLNPLTIDDSASDSDESDSEQPDLTMVEHVVVPPEEPAAAAEAHALYEEHPESAMRTTIVQESYSEGEGSVLVYSSDSDMEEIGEATVSNHASAGSSELDYSSESEVPDSESEDAADAGPYKSTSSYEVESPKTLSVPPTSTAGQPTVQPQDLFSLEDMARIETPSLILFDPNFSNNSFGDSDAPSLPPRPSAPQLAAWNSPGSTSFGQRSGHQAWYSNDTPAQLDYLGTNLGDRPSLFSPAPPSPAQEPEESRTDALFFGDNMGSVHQADRLQTPPPIPTSDITSPKPGRRTKVTIEEIVEEQPPTPTSVNSLKRKADVLEDHESTPVQAPAELLEEVNALADQVRPGAVAAQAAATIAQRPRRQPRSILGKLRNTATYSLMGAAGAVVLLSTLPDTFFA